MSDCLYGIIPAKQYQQKADIYTDTMLDAAVFVNSKSKAYMLLCQPGSLQYDLIAEVNVATVDVTSYQDAEVLESEDPVLDGALLFIANTSESDYRYYDANPTLYESDIVNGAYYLYNPDREIQPVVILPAGHKLFRNGSIIADIGGTVNSYATATAEAFLATDQQMQDDSDMQLPIFKPVNGEWPQPDAYIETSRLVVTNAIISRDGSYVVNLKGVVLNRIFPWVPATDEGIDKQAWQAQYTVRDYFVSIVNGSVTGYQLDVDQRMVSTVPYPTVAYDHQYNAGYRWRMNDGYYCDSLTLDIYDPDGVMIGNVGVQPKCIAKVGSDFLVNTGVEGEIYLLQNGEITTVYENLINNTRMVKTGKTSKIKRALENLFITLG